MRMVIEKTKTSVPIYFAGVFVVQPVKKSVTSVENENVLLILIGAGVDMSIVNCNSSVDPS